MPLINAGSAYRSITGPPVRFALRVYVPQQDLDAHYAPGIPRAARAAPKIVRATPGVSANRCATLPVFTRSSLLVLLQ